MKIGDKRGRFFVFIGGRKTRCNPDFSKKTKLLKLRQNGARSANNEHCEALNQPSLPPHREEREGLRRMARGLASSDFKRRSLDTLSHSNPRSEQDEGQLWADIDVSRLVHLLHLKAAHAAQITSREELGRQDE